MQLQQEKQIAKLNLLRKCGLLALNLASIFEKLLDQKTFQLPAARNLQVISKFFICLWLEICYLLSV